MENENYTHEENGIKRNQNPEIGPMDGVECEVRGILTKFIEQKKRGKMVQSQHNCKIMASVETGTVSISMRRERGLMMTVRLDEMVALVAAALEAGKETAEETSNDGQE